MGKAIKGLENKVFGRLTVIKELPERNKDGEIMWLCRCICGNLVNVRGRRLQNQEQKSCGCIARGMTAKRNYKHGYSKERLFRIWQAMKNRCSNQNSGDFKYYGAKGITIWKRWTKDYVAFRRWALDNGYQDPLTIDRINHGGNYEPNNCQWITQSENARKANFLRWRKEE